MKQEQQQLISIITVNYNELAVTCELLDSLKAHAYWPGDNISPKAFDYEVIVVDNGSPENAYPHLSYYYPEIMIVRSELNLGFAGGNNLGMARSQGDYLFFINNDTIPTINLVERLAAVFHAEPKCGAVSPLICYDPADFDGRDVIQYAGTTPVSNFTARNKTLGEGQSDTGQFSGLSPTPYTHGAAMMVKREVINKVGMMPTVFFLYYEELDWCEQIRRAGYKIFVEPAAKIYHKESLAVNRISALKTFYLTRNRILFMRRNRSVFEILIFTAFLMAVTIPKATVQYTLRGEWQQLKAFYRGILWHMAKPLLAFEKATATAGNVYAPTNPKT